MGDELADPDRYLRTDRIAIALAVILIFVGVGLIQTFKEPNRTTAAVLGSELGSALLTVALVDLLLFTGVKRFKEAVTRDFRNLEEDIRSTHEDLDKFLADTERSVERIRAESHRNMVETDLKMMMIDLEAIHRAVDPMYDEIVKAAEAARETSGKGGDPTPQP